jgi:hypothetical protein
MLLRKSSVAKMFEIGRCTLDSRLTQIARFFPTLMAHNTPFMGTKLQPRDGIPAGLIAGIVMFVVWVFFAHLFGDGARGLIDTIASTFLGNQAFSPDLQLPSFLVGALIHLLISALLGLLYAASLDRLNAGDTLAVSVFYSFTIWVVSSFIVAPWFNSLIQDYSRTWWGFLAFLSFGLVLGAYANLRGVPAPIPHSGRDQLA